MDSRVSLSRWGLGLALTVGFLFAFLLLASPADASRCGYDDVGGGRKTCRVVERPSYKDPGDGPSEEEARGGKNERQLYNQYCHQYNIEYREEMHVHFYSGKLGPIGIDAYDLDPAGEYLLVAALCEYDESHDFITGPIGYFRPLADEWIHVVQEPPDPEVLVEGIREEIEAAVEAIPVEPGDMAPPIDEGVVNTPTWLWVDTPWDPVDDEETYGGVIIWAEAEPVMSRYLVDGEVIAECDGPGTPYTGGPLSEGSDCTGEFEEAAADGRDGKVEIVWEFVWGEWTGVDDFFYGPLGDPYTTSTDVTWTVDEVFSTETG